MQLLLLLFLIGLPSVTLAEVPADLAYQGQLLDASGNPPVAPTIEARIFEGPVGGTALFAEEHAAVAVGPDGRFELAIGTGAPITGALDAALFSKPDRYLELAVNGEVLSPRQPMRSVPFAQRSGEASQVSGVPVFEVVAGNGQVLGTLLSSRDWERPADAKLTVQGVRSLEVLSKTGIAFRVDAASGRLDIRRSPFFASDDCSGLPLLSVVDLGRLVQVLRPLDDLFAYAPQDAERLPPQVPGSRADEYFNCITDPFLPGGSVADLVQSEPPPGDLGFDLPIVPTVTTRPR
jgi:hypothetical protein